VNCGSWSSVSTQRADVYPLALRVSTIGHANGVYFYNNIFFDEVASVPYQLLKIITPTAGTLTFDYNDLYSSVGNNRIMLDGSSHTLAQWQAHGYDAHSITSDPLLDSAYRATKESPVNTGGYSDENYGIGAKYYHLPMFW
jgi:hypothetical protein